MDDAIITGIFTIAGIVVGSALAAIGGWIAGRHAEQAQARDLFVQVVKAISAMEIEKASFRERRDSWRPNFLAIGGALLHIVAASVEGNWVKGAAVGTDGLMAWDSAEGARFADRFLAARSEIGPALVQLSLMSDSLQSAAAEVSSAAAAVMKARKQGDVNAADERLQNAIADLRGAVRGFAARRWWQRS